MAETNAEDFCHEFLKRGNGEFFNQKSTQGDRKGEDPHNHASDGGCDPPGAFHPAGFDLFMGDHNSDHRERVRNPSQTCYSSTKVRMSILKQVRSCQSLLPGCWGAAGAAGASGVSVVAAGLVCVTLAADISAALGGGDVSLDVLQLNNGTAGHCCVCCRQCWCLL